MMTSVYSVFLVAVSSIAMLQVYSQSNDCGYISRKDSEEGNFPWVVAVIRKTKNKYCNGFLIDRRHVLIGASCATPTHKSIDYTARIFNQNWNRSEEYSVSCITRHPRYDPAYVYDDIAIVTLSRDVDTSSITPICLPDDNLGTKMLDGLTIAKWKRDYIRNADTLIQFKGLRTISNRDCNTILFQKTGWIEFIPGAVSGDMLCIDNPTDGLEPCGDFDGAPLMYKDNSNKWIAIGISAMKIHCAYGTPRMYIKISDYVDWIVENTRNAEGKCEWL